MNDIRHNIYQLSQPDEWICKVVACSDGHRMIRVNLEHPIEKSTFMILFLKVRFFSGLTYWKGADFHLASKQELENFVQNIFSYGSTVDVERYLNEWDEDNLRLFIADHAEGHTFILAMAGSLMDTQGNELVPVPDPKAPYE